MIVAFNPLSYYLQCASLCDDNGAITVCRCGADRVGPGPGGSPCQLHEVCTLRNLQPERDSTINTHFHRQGASKNEYPFPWDTNSCLGNCLTRYFYWRTGTWPVAAVKVTDTPVYASPSDGSANATPEWIRDCGFVVQTSFNYNGVARSGRLYFLTVDAISYREKDELILIKEIQEPVTVFFCQG